MYTLSFDSSYKSIENIYTYLFGDRVNSVAFSPDGRFVGGGGNGGKSKIFLAGDNQKLILDTDCLYSCSDCNVKTVAFSPDGWYFFTAGDNNKLGIFNYTFE